MKVLVDTTVWSVGLRRRPDQLAPDQARLRELLADLISDERVVMIGAVRQELLSGLRDPADFQRLRDQLRDFDDEPLATADFEAAADACNACRRAGITGSAIDLLICAVAIRRGIPVLTTDGDFTRYATVLPLRLVPLPAP